MYAHARSHDGSPRVGIPRGDVRGGGGSPADTFADVDPNSVSTTTVHASRSPRHAVRHLRAESWFSQCESWSYRDAEAGARSGHHPRRGSAAQVAGTRCADGSSATDVSVLGGKELPSYEGRSQAAFKNRFLQEHGFDALGRTTNSLLELQIRWSVGLRVGFRQMINCAMTRAVKRKHVDVRSGAMRKKHPPLRRAPARYRARLRLSVFIRVKTPCRRGTRKRSAEA